MYTATMIAGLRYGGFTSRATHAGQGWSERALSRQGVGRQKVECKGAATMASKRTLCDELSRAVVFSSLKPWRDFCSGFIVASMDRNLQAVKFVPNWLPLSEVILNVCECRTSSIIVSKDDYISTKHSIL